VDARNPWVFCLDDPYKALPIFMVISRGIEPPFYVLICFCSYELSQLSSLVVKDVEELISQ